MDARSPRVRPARRSRNQRIGLASALRSSQAIQIGGDSQNVNVRGFTPMTFLRPALLETTYPDLQFIGRERIGGDAVVVTAGTSARGAHRLYFSEATGLLVRRSAEIETQLGAVPERYDFGDFERVDGVMVPKKIVWSRADYEVTFAVSTIRHEANR
jgi:hypothetical protein